LSFERRYPHKYWRDAVKNPIVVKTLDDETKKRKCKKATSLDVAFELNLNI